ncbi:hypothetical protein PIB30_054763 [Stylosanthes scabra]|uniref:Replication protein A 70 kDa DNA-binding subunit B/D first OB fold domain-containing protein n=1 Tax=Stylosanthes scabra TaxID=79078 RepID=A0ABU6XJS2_9FABA|nr:hypothetical protein [Stylosanthes scabra]
MAERFDRIADIHQRKMHWNIQVYVIRMYEVPSYDDRSGVRIHSSIPKKLMSTWGPRLKEFNMHNMRNFVIMDKRLKVKATQISWTLSFCNRIEVDEVDEVDLPTFPLEPFSFRTIPEILNPLAVTETELFDFVAEVVGKEDPRDLTTSKGLDTKRMAIKLQDLEKNSMRCVLFGSCVDEIMPLITEDRVEPLIVVLQFFRVNRWDGKTSIQSHFDISKVCVDAILSDIVEFRNSSVRITQMPTQSSGPGIEQLRRGQVEIKSIEDAWNSTEEGKIWIAGKILSITSGKNDWWYKACDVCPKKVDPKEGGMWECKRCEKITKSYTIRA